MLVLLWNFGQPTFCCVEQLHSSEQLNSSIVTQRSHHIVHVSCRLRLCVMIEVGRSQWPRGPRRRYRRFERTWLHLRRHALQQSVAGQQMSAERRQLLHLRCEACNLDTDWQALHGICVLIVQDGSINVSWVIICVRSSSVPCHNSLGMT